MNKCISFQSRTLKFDRASEDCVRVCLKRECLLKSLLVAADRSEASVNKFRVVLKYGVALRGLLLVGLAM